MQATAQWCGSDIRSYRIGGAQAPEYVMVVSDIDAPVADVFEICSWNPGAYLGTDPAALRRHQPAQPPLGVPE